MTGQLELPVSTGHEHLYPYWRESLGDAVKDAFRYRNARGATGWSYATGGFCFARCLFRAGQMDRREFRRYWRFFRRVWRMELEWRETLRA